jgi:hypothetical protein
MRSLTFSARTGNNSNKEDRALPWRLAPDAKRRKRVDEAGFFARYLRSCETHLPALSDPILAVLFIYVFEESATQFVYPMPQFLPMPWFVSITETAPLFARSLRILLEFPTSTSRFGFISSSSQGINHHTPAEFALALYLISLP